MDQGHACIGTTPVYYNNSHAVNRADFHRYICKSDLTAMAKKYEIKYQMVAPEQFKEAVEFFNDYFLAHEPTTISGSRGSNLLQSDVDKVDQMVLDCLKHNLSWCAVDADTGKIVGLRVAYSQSLADSPDTPPTSDDYVESGYSRHFACVMAMLDLMLDYKKMMMTYQESKMLGLFAVGVHSEYRNEGIAAELVRQTLDHAVKVGFTLAGVNCTSIYTQKLFERQGFQKWKEECYSSFIDAATKLHFLKNVDKTHQSVISYVKKLC